MPTGYTSALYDGSDVDFETFALTCARAFGAAILMRDDPPGPVDPEKVAGESSYHAREIARLQAALDETREWTADEADAAAREAYNEVVAANAERETKRVALKERYEAMLARVHAWEPPTADHVGLKTFMVEQLESSIKFDCSPYETPLVLLTGSEFKAERLSKLEAGLARNETRLAEERERGETRVQWVKALCDSFGVPA